MAFQKASCFSHLLMMVTGLFVCLGGLTTSLNAQTKVDFAKDIKPIFEANCMACHNEEKTEGGFRMDDREEVLDEWVYAGEAADSPLMLDYVLSTDKDFTMPPPENSSHWEKGLPTGPMGDSDIALINTWINEGANWPKDVKLVVPEPVQVEAEAESAVAEAEAKKTPREAPNPSPWNAIGSLHPAALHLPIGLLLGAGLFALLGLRGNFVMSDCAYYCLWFGTIFAIIGCVTGWWFSSMEGQGTVENIQDVMDQEHPVFWHRITSLGVTVFAFLLCLFAAGARNRDPDGGFLWKLGCIVLAGGIGWVGHLGGELTYGENHYKDLINSVEAITSMDINKDGVIAEWPEPKTEIEVDVDMDDEEEGKDSKVGKTSKEG